MTRCEKGMHVYRRLATTYSKGGQWSRPSRRRTETVEAGAKKRFFAPWSKFLVGGVL